MRVLVVGASGVIGTHLVPQLRQRGHEVTGTSRSPGKSGRLRALGAEPIVLDALDANAVRAAAAAAHPDAIIYQATALAGVSDFKHFDASFAATNRLRTEGTDTLLAAARAAGVRRIVARATPPNRHARHGGPVRTEFGVAAGLRNTGQRVGGSIGLAVLGTVAFTVVANSARAAAARAAAAGIMLLAALITAATIRIRKADLAGVNPILRNPEDIMKLTIIAATGGVGRQLLGQALDAGHDVTAVARNPAKLPRVLADQAARIVAADLAGADLQVLGSAVAGADAVLSALGPHNNSDAGIAAPGTRSVTAAMAATSVRRIVAISASPVGTQASPGRPDPPRHDPGDGFFMRHVGVRIPRALFGKVYEDLALMEDVLRESGLDWTVLRPPQLTGKPLTGRYRTAVGRNVRGGRSVPRADVAHYMLAVLAQPETIGQIIGIAT